MREEYSSDLEEKKRRGRPRKEGERDAKGRLLRKKINPVKRADDKKDKPSKKRKTDIVFEEEDGQDEWELPNTEIKKKKKKHKLDPEQTSNKDMDLDSQPLSKHDLAESLNKLYGALVGQPSRNEGQHEQDPMLDQNLLEPAERTKKIRLISAYKSKFEKYLGDQLKKQCANLESKTDEKLVSLEEEVKFAVFAGNQSRVVQDAYFNVCSVLEVPLGARGYTEKCKEKKLVDDILAELSIKYQNSMYVEPEWRLLYATLVGMLAQRMENKAMDPLMSQPLSSEIRSTFNKIFGQ